MEGEWLCGCCELSGIPGVGPGGRGEKWGREKTNALPGL